jgi:AraC-like DNA-binding protein
MWRPSGEDRVLAMAGRTTSYAIEPRGEYVFGVVSEQQLQSRRGHERRLVRPGQVVAWDPSGAHRGTAVDGHAWASRLIIVEVGDLAHLGGDHESDLPVDLEFPEPVITNKALALRFLQLHVALEASTTRLERDEQLADWLRTVIEGHSTHRPPKAPLSSHDDRALRDACNYLGDQPQRNISLDELAAVAGIGKFRLIRLFREQTGLPPHALQIAHRVRTARRLLEAGATIVDAAAATGFADQSHLHRQFQPSLGLTPGEYRHRFHAR